MIRLTLLLFLASQLTACATSGGLDWSAFNDGYANAAPRLQAPARYQAPRTSNCITQPLANGSANVTCY